MIERINALLVDATSYYSPDDIAIRRLIREAQDAIRADPATGHSAMASVYQIIGDAERARHHAEESIKFSKNPVLLGNRSSFLSNFLFASEGQSAFGEAVAPENGWMKQVWQQGYAVGAFETMRTAIVTARKLQLDLEGLDVATAERAAGVLEKVKISQAEVGSVLDAAGEVLRKHRLFFVGQAPRIDVWDGDGRMPFIRSTIKVAVSQETAHEMYLELIDKILDRSLQAHRAVSVEFEGATASDERKAA